MRPRFSLSMVAFCLLGCLGAAAEDDIFAANKRLGRGINIGNALEAPKEGEWSVTLKEAYFQAIKEAGFASVRLPIKWSAHAQMEAPYAIDATFAERIDWAVEQATKNRLNIILNVHHYGEMDTQPDEHLPRLVAIWEQIAARYKDKPANVYFELLNEPHAKLIEAKWNAIIPTLLAAIRKTNPARPVIVGPAFWNAIWALDKLELPADKNLILTVHYYDPHKFTHQGAPWAEGSDKWKGMRWSGTEQEQSEVRKSFNKAAQWAKQQNRPVLLGEFGAYQEADLDSRVRWTRFIAREAEKREFSWTYWEFCAGFGAYDPQADKWRPELKGALLATDDPPPETVLFDFENAADLAGWETLVQPNAKEQAPVKIEQSAEHATAGKQGLKLTFGGGRWPMVTTTKVDDTWLKYQTFHADVFASRRCLVGFTVMQEQSQRGEGWDPVISRWTKTAFLQPGQNHITGPLPQPNDYALHPKWGKVVRIEIFMYTPHEGESIFVDNIRLNQDKLPSPALTTFRLDGTDWSFVGKSSTDAVIELGKQRKDTWVKPTPKTVADVEGAFKTQYAELKKQHPRAVLAILRDGEKGYDPAAPDMEYAGWKDVHINSHGPDGMTISRSDNRGKAATQETFMRHRSTLMQVDFSSIPPGSNILAAKLVMERHSNPEKDRDPEQQSSMWVVEPCNRPWVETEVNAYEYAKDKFWKAIGGMAWGDDPDFHPIFLAHGPGQGKVTEWDFTRAVRYWTDGQHANHGCMLHGDSRDYLMGYTREAESISNRPAVLVVYEPK